MSEQEKRPPAFCPHCEQQIWLVDLLYPGWGYCTRCGCWRHSDGTPNASWEQPEPPQHIFPPDPLPPDF